MTIKSDINELSSSHENLLRELAFKTQVLDIGFEPVFILNPDGSILGLNEAAAATFGFEKDSLVGRDFSERIIAPVCRDSFWICFERLVRNETGPFLNRRIELSAMRSDRTEIAVEFSIRIVRIEERTQYVMNIRDITEEKKTELLLRESESRFRRLFDSNMMGVLFWDIHGNISEANENFIKMLGYTRKDVAQGSLSLKKITPHEYENLDFRIGRELSQNGMSAAIEREYFHKDGSRIPALVASAFLEGSQTRAVSVIQEISSQKEHSRTLNEANAMLRAMVNGTNDAIFIKDNQSKIQIANDAMSRLLNLPLNAIVGQSEERFFTAETVERIANIDRKIFETGESSSFEMSIANKSVLVKKTALRDNNGRIIGIISTIKDLTDMRRVEVKLAHSQKQFVTALEGVTEAVTLQEQTGSHRITFANKAAQLLLDLDPYSETIPEELVWLNPDASVFQYERFPAQLALNGFIEPEALTRLHRKGDSHQNDRWVLVKSTLIQETEKNLSSILTFYRDITDHRKLEDLSQQQAAAMKASIDGLIVFSANNEIIFANQASANLYGYNDASEMIGKSWKVLFSEQDIERIQYEILTKVTSSDQWRSESFGRRANETVFENEISMSRIRSGGMVWVIRDITVQKRALLTERVLNQVATHVPSSLNFAKTIDSLVEVVVSTGLADWSVVYLIEKDEPTRAVAKHRNPSQAENMLKLSQHFAPRIEKDSPSSKIIRSGKSILTSEFGDAGFKRVATSPEHENLLRSIGISSTILVPLFIEGKLIGGVSFIRSQPHFPYCREDVSLAEELVRRASIAIENAKLYEKAQNAVIARNDFVAMVSHDLKNPLSAILLNSAFIKRNLARENQLSEKDENLKRQIEAMERSAQRMNSLICDFLDLARIEAGRLVIDRQLYKLNTLIRDALEMLQPLAAVKSIALNSLVMDGLPELGFFDRERIFQVLSNLVGNAIKFTPDGGKIELALQLVGSDLIFSVRDTGPGISKVQLPHVFDRYWQAKENYRAGSGLGLNIAKGIVESHNGKIWVESEAGRGSVFFFSLPHPNN
jgi:PAS domain S-box-containing protein